MGRVVDLTGQRFGRLLVLYKDDKNNKKDNKWICRCDCGNVISAYTTNLTRGKSTSCGCYRNELSKERMTTHGHSNDEHRLYRVWDSMRQRCNNKNDKAYKNYGGRGICVCCEWQTSFEAFRNLAIESGYSDALTIERIDVNKNYCPENCKWIPFSEQAANTRRNRFVTIDGETHTLREWARIKGINPGTVYSRINSKHWDEVDAITRPVRRRNNG